MLGRIKECINIVDMLLDFVFDYSILNLFKKLCRYYYRINLQATAECVLAYRDLWDDEKGS